MRVGLMMLGAMCLAGCNGLVPKQDPVVTQFNGYSVTIIQPALSTFSDKELQSMAQEICQRGITKNAERVSKRVLPNYEGTSYLFLCLGS